MELRSRNDAMLPFRERGERLPGPRWIGFVPYSDMKGIHLPRVAGRAWRRNADLYMTARTS
jgi:hypothetical protein